jgi:peptide/nickel transport system permease protein
VADPARAPRSLPRRLVAHPTGRLALTVIVALIVVAIVGPMLTSHSSAEQFDITRLKNAPPSLRHPFGTDLYSRDVLSRVLLGARISLAIAMLAVLLSTTVATAYGLIAGFLGGRIDGAMMRVIDALLAIPRVFVLIAVLTLWHPIPLAGLIVLLGLTGWFGVARLVRAEVLTLRTSDYVAAARALGASNLRIIVSHLLPNAAAPAIVGATLGVGNVIAIEAGLSYLGIGVADPTPSWGSIFLDGVAYFPGVWWVTVFPGVAIVIAVIAFNLLGDALRDVLDPRQLPPRRPPATPVAAPTPLPSEGQLMPTQNG